MAISIGAYITELRTEKQMSMRELALKAGVDVSSVSRVESGKRQKAAPAFLRAIAPVLGVDYGDLMRVAGYIQEEEDVDGLHQYVFKDSNGEIVDVWRGVSEMFRKDEDWANVAFRVSRDLSPEDRKILSEMAESFLKNRTKKD